MCVSGGKKCYFFGKFCIPTKWMIQSKKRRIDSSVVAFTFFSENGNRRVCKCFNFRMIYIRKSSQISHSRRRKNPYDFVRFPSTFDSRLSLACTCNLLGEVCTTLYWTILFHCELIPKGKLSYKSRVKTADNLHILRSSHRRDV